MRHHFLILLAALAMPPIHHTPARGAEPATLEQPVELGKVHWLRDYDAAVQRAKDERKPLLILFSEVPGCQTCKSYGSDILSHPLIVEAAETQFIPLAIYNNVQGRDHDILTSFCEAEWNNPVVRIVDVEKAPRTDIVPRVSDDFTLAGLTGAMVAALEKREAVVPGYLSLLKQEASADASPVPPAVFAMHCFWTGEEKLGGFNGVVNTRVGMFEGKEVVEVTYDSSSITFANLIREARRQECLDYVYARSEDQFKYARRIVGDNVKRTGDAITVSDADSLKRLRDSFYRVVPMTPAQARRVNASLASGGNPDDFLSLRQIRFRGLAARHPDADWPRVAGRSDLAEAFAEAEWFAASLEKPAN